MIESLSQINEIMRRKIALLNDMSDLSAQTAGYISESEVEPLFNSIEAKRDIILQIDSLDNRFLLLFGRLKNDLGVASIDELRRSQIEGLDGLWQNTATIAEQLKKIREVDIKAFDKIKKLQDRIAADLNRIRAQKHASGQYVNGVQPRRASLRSIGRNGTNFDVKN